MKKRVCKRCGKVVESRAKCCSRQARKTCGDGYDRKWQRFRERVIRKRLREGRGFCVMCGLAFAGKSIHADHIVPVEGQDDPLFFDEGNIQLLHPSCHAEKTQRDVRSGRTRR